VQDRFGLSWMVVAEQPAAACVPIQKETT